MFSDPPELTESTVSASKSCLSFFELKKVEEDLGFSLLKIIKLCGFTLLLLMRKTKLMSSAFALLCLSRKRFAGSKNRQFWVHRAVPLTD